MNKLKDIEGYEGLYGVDRMGNVYSHRRKKYLSPGVTHGHQFVILYNNGKRKLVMVHRLVAKAFIPNPKNLPVVNHIDGNKNNNCVTNLEWCTQKENVHHCIAMGTFAKMGREAKLREMIQKRDIGQGL